MLKDKISKLIESELSEKTIGEMNSKFHNNLNVYEIKRIILRHYKTLFTPKEFNDLLNCINREEANNKLIKGEITPKEYGEMMQGSTLNLKKQTR
jgi:hypothetical protein